MNQRPSIPTKLKREVLTEAGHRCAIPTCRQTPVEIAHIDAWKNVNNHEYENLIALCPTCHTRFDRGDIDRQSMLIYKSNLWVLSNRYCDFEIRTLEEFSKSSSISEITLPGGLDIMLSYLMKDNLIFEKEESSFYITGIPSHKTYGITPKGRSFVERWLSGKEIT